MHTRDSLQKDLKQGGILPSDTLLVHSSMKSIGEVEGGADTVLDALMEYFKKDGLLVFPTLTYGLNEENPIFDVRKTPSQVGLLSNLFWMRPGVSRSLHPTHSVAAWGKDAASFLAGHDLFDTPCAKGSPWGRLLDRKAKILFIGTPGIGCNTFLHGVEEWFGVPEMFREKKHRLLVMDESGIEHVALSRRHFGAHSHNYGKMEPLFAKHGALTYLHFGDAASYLLDCKAVYEITFRCLERDPLLFTHQGDPKE